jgi:hypothetical protein
LITPAKFDEAERLCHEFPDLSDRHLRLGQLFRVRSEPKRAAGAGLQQGQPLPCEVLAFLDRQPQHLEVEPGPTCGTRERRVAMTQGLEYQLATMDGDGDGDGDGEAAVMRGIEYQLATARDALLHHPMYSALSSLRRLRIFMANHVFAVWDFMTVLKALQSRLTCITTPWLPHPDPSATRIINEIVLCEESDEISPGEYLDHFRLYLTAMREIAADTQPAEQLVEALRNGCDVEAALDSISIAPATRRFVSSTLEVVKRPMHELAAVFLFGRENLIPLMFTRILEMLDASGLHAVAFRTYLRRHVTIDGEQHGPRAQDLLARICGDDPTRWREATQAAHAALESRRALWDSILVSFHEDANNEPT